MGVGGAGLELLWDVERSLIHAVPAPSSANLSPCSGSRCAVGGEGMWDGGGYGAGGGCGVVGDMGLMECGAGGWVWGWGYGAVGGCGMESG